MVVPIVAATGILVRNTADKFTTLSLPTSGLPQRSEILDRYGHLLAYVYGVDMPYYTTASRAQAVQVDGLNRQPVSYNQISQNMTNAIVGIEDDRYWQHGAIDLKGTIRAAVNDLQHKAVQGGSTIAQQYVKGVLILQAVQAGNQTAIQQAQADTLSRKLNELRTAVEIEHQLSKEDILAGYLNDAYFGSQAWGIEAAAETYFATTSAKLTLTQAATLAGIVENPSRYDPIAHPAEALQRRNTVLDRMAATNNGITMAQAKAAEKAPLGLNVAPVQSGCEANTVGSGAGFFCEYVEEVFLHDPTYGATPQSRAKLLATGGLQIYTTLDPKDQAAATNAVNYVVPDHSGYYNPGHNAGTEAVIQPGTGEIRAIAEDRTYGTGPGQTELDYAVNTPYGGLQGVQTGSSSKLFTLVTALEQGVPFGFTKTVPGTEIINGYTDCHGDATQPFNVTNSEGSGTTTDSLYTGTTGSINVFFAELEKQVGLCNVVHTAVNLGMTRVDGTSLLSWDGNPNKPGSLPPADSLPTFTLGTVNVSPLSMAAAYATMAARGMYCTPIAIDKITTDTGGTLAVPSAGCHRAVSAAVADAVNYILQGVLTNGTASYPGGLSGREAAGKTGTSNIQSGNGTPYAAFAGYTPSLASFTSVFYPAAPTSAAHAMGGQNGCYRLETGELSNCGGEMFGANAPASTWHMTFDHANLGSAAGFVPVPGDSPFNSQGNGQVVKQPCKPSKKNNNCSGNGNGGGGNGGGGNGGGGGGGNGGGGNGGGGNGGGGNGGGGNGGGGNGGGPGGFGGNNAAPAVLPAAASGVKPTAAATRRTSTTAGRRG